MEFDEEITQMYENLNEMGEEQILQIRQRIRNQDEEEEIEENRITILKCQRLNKYILFHNMCRFTFDQFDDIWNQLKDHMPESRYKGRRYKLLTKKDHLFMLITYLSHGCSYKALEKQFGMDKSWISQLFVTLRGRVIDIVSGIKGAVHDITIAKQSKLEQMVKTNDPNFSYGFLCDRGYVGLQHKIPSAVICKKKTKRYDHKYFVPMFNICCALTNKNFEYQPLRRHPIISYDEHYRIINMARNEDIEIEMEN
ncbi:hypothetical protein M0813_08930 [Anaeramoeba flamelloides]|uniref:DDE Tnp4 domain-containing protein n=1 Tax=Anaeramoeba flamelloides TaxID=1746091 RepID=A0ABQ8X6T1_9EUKA|nr:hypothetical protein M0813_08930 [Anaeramoeba flamelloides]